MITEDYVSLEVAKLLKEMGFIEETKHFYDDNGIFCDGRMMWNWNVSIRRFSAPTLQMVMKWLREVHKLWCEVSWEGKNAWFVDIFSLKDEEYIMFKKIHNVPTYEEACEEAIKYCLENLI